MHTTTTYCFSFCLKAKFHYAILVTDRFEAGRRPAVSWNLAYLRPAADLSTINFEPVCNQDSVMEFGLDQLRTWFELSRHVQIARTCSNLVADPFKAKFHYAILVADRFEADHRQLGADLLACASSLDDRPNSSSLQVCDQLRTCL